MKNKNLLAITLECLNIKHTKKEVNKIYEEHPHKYSMYGLSKMLLDYGIHNRGIRIKKDKYNLYQINNPFLAHIGNTFLLVSKITDKQVHCIWNGKNINIIIDHFLEIWTGIVLLIEAKKDAIEPNYKENKKKEVIASLQKYIFFIISILIIGLTILEGNYSIGTIFTLTINLIGGYIGYLLITRQIKSKNNFADKICSLLKQSDCNNVLESPAASLFNIVSWSEIGFSFFISNIIIILFIPQLLPYYALINIITLPYTFWSIWYQKYRAKQWCPLCLIILLIIWATLLVNIRFNHIHIPNFAFSEILCIIALYLYPLLTLKLLLPQITESEKLEIVTQTMNSIIMKKEVFTLLLKEQPYYPVNKDTSNIIFGNRKANTLITIFTNPHCAPCADLHRDIDAFLDKLDNSYCIQYIFSAFDDNNKDFIESNKLLISAYFNKTEKEAKKIFFDWYTKGKFKKTNFIEKHNLNIDNTDINKELISHQKWKNNTGLMATPTILINGYELPYYYKNFDDLKYFVST